MSVRSAVEEVLAGQSGWQVELARALAAEVDEKGTASAAKELRSVMSDLGADVSASADPKKETPASDFERRLREREAKTSRRSATG